MVNILLYFDLLTRATKKKATILGQCIVMSINCLVVIGKSVSRCKGRKNSLCPASIQLKKDAPRSLSLQARVKINFAWSLIIIT